MSIPRNEIEVGDIAEVGFVFLGHVDTLVGITAAGGTATVAHVAHELETGDEIVIFGATPDGYNGPHTITVVDADSYTYDVPDGLSSPAGGTPTEKAPLRLITPTEVSVAVKDGDGTELTAYDQDSEEVDLGAVLSTALREELAAGSGGAFTADDIATGRGVVRLRQPVGNSGVWQYVCTATAGVEGASRATSRVRRPFRN